jgi:lipoprotein-anchoring transpeptidase ErfK/SrfK
LAIRVGRRGKASAREAASVLDATASEASGTVAQAEAPESAGGLGGAGGEAAGAPPIRRAPWLLVLVLVALALAALYGIDRISQDNLLPGTQIGGVPIGSLSVTDAAAIVESEVVSRLHEEITLRGPQFEQTASAWDMGMRLDATEVVEDVNAVQRSRPWLLRLSQRVFGDRRDVPVVPVLDEAAFDRFLGEVVERVNREPRDAELVIDGDDLSIVPHELGRQIDRDTAAERIYNALTSGAPSVNLPVETFEPALTSDSFETAILISTSQNTLRFYRNGELERFYNVATGTGGHPTPHGQFHITAKRPNPTWYNPGSPWAAGMPAFIPPGRNNPLGTRALNLSAPLIRIHGTPESGSIGSNASRGCIRMHIHEAEELYEKVDVGTPVLIVS